MLGQASILTARHLAHEIESSEILRVVEDLAFEKKLTSKEQALEYVIKHFVR